MSTDNERLHGMTREEWRETEVAKATSVIACQHCGERFATPHDFYDHLDSQHPKKGRDGKRRR